MSNDRKASIVRWVRVIGPAVVVLAAILAMSGPAGAAVGRDGARPPLQASPQDNYTPSGPLVADSGFRPISDGFSFKNYGCDANRSDHSCAPQTDLTPAAMRTLFGDGVCATAPSDTCTLTPKARHEMDVSNKGMSGGHCFGLSVTSLELWKKLSGIAPTQFGANSTPAIRLIGNTAIQAEIAYNWETQNGSGTQQAQLVGTPNQILQTLINGLTPTAPDTYTISFWNGFNLKKGQEAGGHAVTPYAVENHGGGIYAVLIYDNNFPKITRAIFFDTNSNTWIYRLTPSWIWQGNAKDPEIALVPTSSTLGPQTLAASTG